MKAVSFVPSRHHSARFVSAGDEKVCLCGGPALECRLESPQFALGHEGFPCSKAVFCPFRDAVGSVFG